MVAIETMYSVVHGAYKTFPMGGETSIPISPSRDLLKKIDSLSPGTNVGIEYTPELAGPVWLGEGYFNFQESDIGYWERIQEICGGNDLDVVYLDDIDLHKEAARLYVQHVNLTRGLVYEGENGKRFWDMRRKAYSNLIQNRYIHEHLREQKIWENIRQNQPEVVIVGKAHGDMFATEDWVKNMAQIDVTNFFTERIPDWLGKTSLTTTPENTFALDRRQLIMRHNLLEAGTFLPELRPSYVGVFQSGDQYTPEEGFFEIHQNITEGGDFSGLMFDNFGIAKISGEFNGSKVRFEKDYIPGQTLSRVPTTLYYEASKTVNGFVGNWQIPGLSGEFVLTPYHPGMDTEALRSLSLDVLKC